MQASTLQLGGAAGADGFCATGAGPGSTGVSFGPPTRGGGTTTGAGAVTACTAPPVSVIADIGADTQSSPSSTLPAVMTATER